MSKHTPGPWVTEAPDWDEVPEGSISVHQGDWEKQGNWVASVHTQFSSIDNGSANARLIAAAPCMVKLLEDILDSDEVSQDQADEIIAILKRIKNDI